MQMQTDPRIDVPSGLIDAIRSFPLHREVEHCGSKFAVSPFQIYASCPRCGNRIKLRSFSAIPEIEDVFDAVFEWMSQPGAAELAERRQHDIEADRDE
jgi:predicted  nucleic acid-binding Zn-ribbon protein